MPIHIGEIHSDVTVHTGDFPLDPQQIEQLVQMILARLADQQRQDEQRTHATRLDDYATDQSPYRIN